MRYVIHYYHDLYVPNANPRWTSERNYSTDGFGPCYTAHGRLVPKYDPNIRVFARKALAERWVKKRKQWMAATGQDEERQLRVEEYP